MSLTTDPKHPDLGHGVDQAPRKQNSVYLVLSEEERARGFVRPVRTRYIHVGIAGPQFPLRDLTEEEGQGWWKDDPDPFVKFEAYPDGSSSEGCYWTQKQLDSIGKGCNSVTNMELSIAETYARHPGFYGSTYCVQCSMHFSVGADGEFVWEDGSRVGT